MKVTKKNLEKFREEFQMKFIEAFEKEFGTLEEIKANYSETEWRVMMNSFKFKELPEMAEELAIAMDMLIDRWNDIVDLEEYMDSGQWQADYEADERGEIRKDLPRDVLSQDALYNTLQELNLALKDLKWIARRIKSKKAVKSEKSAEK